MDSEILAVRQSCGLLRADFRSVLRVVGADRSIFLQGMLSNDVAKLAPGQGCLSALLTQQAKLVSDLRVLILAEEIWLDVPALRATVVREALERFIVADDVEFAEADMCQPLVSLEGPQAARVVLAVFGEALDRLDPYGHRPASFDGITVRIAAVTHTGEAGLLVLGPPSHTASVIDKCLAAGAEAVGSEAIDVLRIEAGIPCFGRDMNDTSLVSEVGLEGAFSFTKGCYLGQEVVERVAARGQVQKKLVGLICEGDRPPTTGSTLLAADKEVGLITSAAWSPSLKVVIALGYVRREHWDVGNMLQIAAGGRARVAALPFVARKV